MRDSKSHDRELIARLSAHIDDAIRASPCTCVTLRHDVILTLVLLHGLESERRISAFSELYRARREKFARALLHSMHDPLVRSQINYIYDPLVNSHRLNQHNNVLNSVYVQGNLGEAVRECEELAVAYNASIRHMWTITTALTRHIDGTGELESMLSTFELRSNRNDFVSTSITQSPWFNNRDVFYLIKSIDHYRKYATPLQYVSVFAIAHPELLRGPKSLQYPEDEIRLENGTPIKADTIDIVFRSETPLSDARITDLRKRYAPLGRVRTERP